MHLAVFDLLAVGDADWRPRRYSERRRRLLDVLEDGPPLIRPVPATGDVDTALQWVGGLGGVEGVVMKPNLPYVPGRGSGWLKWRRIHTSEAAVLGVSGRTPATQCLILGLPRSDGRMRAVGVSLPWPKQSAASWRRCCSPPARTKPSCPARWAGCPAPTRSATGRSSRAWSWKSTLTRNDRLSSDVSAIGLVCVGSAAT